MHLVRTYKRTPSAQLWNSKSGAELLRTVCGEERTLGFSRLRATLSSHLPSVFVRKFQSKSASKILKICRLFLAIFIWSITIHHERNRPHSSRPVRKPDRSQGETKSSRSFKDKSRSRIWLGKQSQNRIVKIFPKNSIAFSKFWGLVLNTNGDSRHKTLSLLCDPSKQESVKTKEWVIASRASFTLDQAILESRNHLEVWFLQKSNSNYLL